jgi:two-component system sensor histidine kinase YesM
MIYWFLLLLDVFVVLIFINSINHYFINYLNQIMEGIRQVEKGNFDVQLVVDRRDEFGRIGENFNHMTGTVKELIQEVQEISQKKTKAEIKALEYQINPHFLYNTLDAINWMAVEKNEFEISRMVSNLGFILRYSINKENERVKLSDVEEWLKSYVPLYQIRYGYSFEFQIYMEDEVREKKIHKFLIQPIVENAILHGIKDMEGAVLQVNIGLDEQSGRIHIIVEDNGIGMEKEKIDIYNQRDRTWTGTDRIGLANIFERIQLYYGEKGEWHISSVEGMGTIMEFLLPPEDKETM